ncbi:MAG: type II pantothenate kinase [Clostridia bacterium]|nr:type II pantothenate kinase [Clostridia bacterium]
MSKIIGIDVGGSTTKIVGFDGEKMICPLFVKASDQLASVYGAFGKFTDTNSIALSEIDRVMITGVGSTFLADELYGIKAEHISEFECVGKGGLYLSGLERAIIVSMGTGTSIVHATKDGLIEYMGGTGVGGGTVIGLAKKMLGISDIVSLIDVAAEGNLQNIDLTIADITKKDIGLESHMTAANFGKVSDVATKGDLALGLINMVFESVGMLAVFAARSKNIKDVILTGNLVRLPQAKTIAETFSTLFGLNFSIPENAEFATAIGAALR